jgi:predicted ribosome quality control (RQC) complex YloA/Tae2 family protein
MDERAEIEAAMDRLLAGIPLRSDGKLTVVSLAAEAGVKRHALTHKHTDLKDSFYARIKAQHSVPASETKLREQIADLVRKLNDMRAERDEYKQAADALARTLNVLTVENDELRRKANPTVQPTGPRPLSRLTWMERSVHRSAAKVALAPREKLQYSRERFTSRRALPG